MANKSFTQQLQEARGRDSYWAEKVKLQFANELFDLMERRDVNKTQLAEKISSSASYVTKALRGDTNFTIDSLVKLVRALDGKVEIRVAASEDKEHNFRVIGCQTRTFSAVVDTPVQEGGEASDHFVIQDDDTSLEVA